MCPSTRGSGTTWWPAAAAQRSGESIRGSKASNSPAKRPKQVWAVQRRNCCSLLWNRNPWPQPRWLSTSTSGMAAHVETIPQFSHPLQPCRLGPSAKGPAAQQRTVEQQQTKVCWRGVHSSKPEGHAQLATANNKNAGNKQSSHQRPCSMAPLLLASNTPVHSCAAGACAIGVKRRGSRAARPLPACRSGEVARCVAAQASPRGQASRGACRCWCWTQRWQRAWRRSCS